MMYFHSVHGKNIQLSADNSQAKRISGFCQGMTFSNNPLTPLQRVTFVVSSDFSSKSASNATSAIQNYAAGGKSMWKKQPLSQSPPSSSSSSSSACSSWTGNLRIGVTTRNPTSLISTELPEFSYPTLLNVDGFWITCIKSSYLRSGNKISLVLDKNNCLQLAINYVVKATLFGNNMIPNTPQTKLWLILDIYGATNFVQFLPSDETPYEIKERGLDAINNFHSACLTGGSKSIYKTRLLILGQDDSGKISLKNSLINFKSKSSSTNKKKQLDLSASFRVKIDTKSNWHLKAVLNNERFKKPLPNNHHHHQQQQRYNHHHKLSRNLSQSSNNIDQMNKSNRLNNNNSNNNNRDMPGFGGDSSLTMMPTANSPGAAIEVSNSLGKRKSSSTSYLNEEDDYDDDYDNSLSMSMSMRQFRQAQRLSKVLNETEATTNERNSLSTQPTSIEHNRENEQTDEAATTTTTAAAAAATAVASAHSLSDLKSDSSESSPSENEENDEDENDPDLYAIEECEEVFSTLDYESNELKKDPTGYSYKKITMNIYRELFATKLWDKLWSTSESSLSSTTAPTGNNSVNDIVVNNTASTTTTTTTTAVSTTTTNNEIKLDELNVLSLYNNNKNNSSSSGGGGNLFNSNSSITENVFEKIALMEFEASIYNQLSCSKILLFYFQRIVLNEIKSMRNNKPSRTILVSPVEKKELILSSSSSSSIANANNGTAPALPGSVDYFATWAQNTDNLKLMSKKLSLTISDLADQSYQILLSSRAVYIVCFDLTKNLDELCDTNFELGSKKNEEMTNLDYLDFVFKSIHYNTAKLANTMMMPPQLPANAQSKLKSSEEEANEIKMPSVGTTTATTSFRMGLMSPPILLVGTNKNGLVKQHEAVAARNELIRKKFERIREFISNKIYANHILEPYFAIENQALPVIMTTTTTPSSKENSPRDPMVHSGEEQQQQYLLDSDSSPSIDLELLKRYIQIAALSEPYMGEQQPIKWMNFDKSLEKLKNKGLFYASLSQICEIAHEKDINTQEELTTCLNFLNDLGQIIYYGNANDIFLRNTIILRPQKLIEIFNMVLNAKMPSWLENAKLNQQQQQQQQVIKNQAQSSTTTTPSSANSKNNITNTSNNNMNTNASTTTNAQTQEWLELWEKFDQRGILHDRLLDVLWKNVINQKPGLLGLMKKFDLICERNISTTTTTTTPSTNAMNNYSTMMMVGNAGITLGARHQFGSEHHLNQREYLVPSRAKIAYDEYEAVTELIGQSLQAQTAAAANARGHRHHHHDDDYDDEDENDSDNSDFYDSSGRNGDYYEDSREVSSDGYFGASGRHSSRTKKNRILNDGLNVEFYYDFCGFLPESLFDRIITRAARWTLMKSGANPKTAVSMYYRKARFYLDDNHFFTIQMLPIKYSRIKIEIIRINLRTNGFINDPMPPDPNACAKVRNFMETTLLDLRNLWMKRLMFYACVQCSCDKLCDLHQLKICNDLKCMHFLNLDECLTNNIVTCDYRRVKTLVYKSWFPTQNISRPVLAAVKTYSDKNMFYEESSLPSWIKNVAKLLQTYGKDKEAASKEKEATGGQPQQPAQQQPVVVTVQNENDWLALARLLGYSKSKINYFSESDNPALQLICDWIMSSDNTNLTIEFLLNYLEQIKREDVIKIINNEREKETVNSSIFISYHWDSQEIVIKIKEHLEKAGFNCFMDIGQIGGGNLLYQKIDQAIRNAKVVIACITPKFVVSHYCNREMALADLLHKPIVPIVLTATPWPPPGGMGLIFAQLVYVDYFGVGGHGGCGINADRDQRNNEIVAMCSRHINPSSYFLMNIDRLTDSNDKSLMASSHQNGAGGANNSSGGGGRSKRTFLETLKPSQIIRSSQYYGGNNGNGSGGGNRRSSSNNNNNNGVARQQNGNQFMDEINMRSGGVGGGNFLLHHQSHLINQQMAAQHHNAQRGGSNGGGGGGLGAGLRGGGGSGANGNFTINLNRVQMDTASRDSNRCAVCSIV